jgi:hypothetical protein
VASADGRDLDDVAVPLPTEHGQGRARHVHDAEEVCLHLRAEVVLTHVLDRVDVRVTGIVDDDVEAAEGGSGNGNGCARGRGIGHVEGRCAHPLAVPRDEIVEIFKLARCGNKAVAGGKHGASQGRGRGRESFR